VKVVTSRSSAGGQAVAAFALILALCISAQAQPTIGLLGNSRSSNAAFREAFRQGLRDLGYSEGKNINLLYRWAEGNLDRMKPGARELVNLNVAIIIIGGAPATRAAKQETTTIPIVMAQDIDPVANGFVSSLAKPGGNITGLATLLPELSGKRIELLKEVAPKSSRIAVIGSSTTPGNTQSLREVERVASSMGIEIVYCDVNAADQIENAFHSIRSQRADALIQLASPILISRRQHVTELATKTRLPAVYGQPEFTEAGGLLSYGPNLADLWRRAATYVDKILKGAKPAELPVEQPTKFELVINLKTAKQIGLTIPPNVLARADRVIK
jgi:putative ABC transport system substrate-binding protein